MAFFYLSTFVTVAALRLPSGANSLSQVAVTPNGEMESLLDEHHRHHDLAEHVAEHRLKDEQGTDVCSTDGSAGSTAPAGAACVFPFTYEGVEYNECTDAGYDHPWCPTYLDEVGEFGMWGVCVCSSGCSSACSSESAPCGWAACEAGHVLKDDATLLCAATPCTTADDAVCCDPSNVAPNQAHILDCAAEPWTPWGHCSQTCGGGIQSRTRVVDETNDLSCDENTETQVCNQDSCPINCQWEPWSVWGDCSVTCEDGIQIRDRQVVVAAAHDGADCTKLDGSSLPGPVGSDEEEQQDCSLDACPIDCEMYEWEDWGECNAPCGGGQEHRIRNVKTEPDHGGAVCPSEQSQSQNCNEHACPIDCEMGLWGDWGACSNTCGAGTKSRSRSTTVDAQHGGAHCHAEPTLDEHCPCDASGNHILTSSATCLVVECPIHCVMTEWEVSGTCTEPCGGGVQLYTRSIETAAQHDGHACQDLQKNEPCNTHNCPIPCILSEFGEWSNCYSGVEGEEDVTITCGGGVQIRDRTILQDPLYGADACDALRESQDCNTHPCPCVLSQWTPWGVCNADCGEGEKTRTRHIQTAAQELNGEVGEECATNREEQAPCQIIGCCTSNNQQNCLCASGVTCAANQYCNLFTEECAVEEHDVCQSFGQRVKELAAPVPQHCYATTSELEFGAPAKPSLLEHLTPEHEYTEAQEEVKKAMSSFLQVSEHIAGHHTKTANGELESRGEHKAQAAAKDEHHRDKDHHQQQHSMTTTTATTTDFSACLTFAQEVLHLVTLLDNWCDTNQGAGGVNGGSALLQSAVDRVTVAHKKLENRVVPDNWWKSLTR